MTAATVDWQDGDWQGNDTASFTAPGIGTGVITCNLNTQWVNFLPSDLGSDTEMWAVILRGNEASVRAAAHRSTAYGDELNLGLNRYAGEPSDQGMMTGIISSRGPIGSPGGAGPPPTTFRLSWYWSFDDSYGPRCYVNATFVSSR